jgi:hypothetical protein
MLTPICVSMALWMAMSERVARLRQQSLEARPTLSSERAELMTEFYRQTSGAMMSAPMRRALAFKYLMEHKTICINEGELIVGEKGPAPKATPTYPELCCHSLEDLDILNSRPKRSPSPSAPRCRQVYEEQIIPFWQGQSMRDLIFREMTAEWKAPTRPASSPSSWNSAPPATRSWTTRSTTRGCSISRLTSSAAWQPGLLQRSRGLRQAGGTARPCASAPTP